MFVTLKAKTPSGADVLSKHGDVRRVVNKTDSVGFSKMPGPWLLLESPKDLRWVHATSDDNFALEEYGSDMTSEAALALERSLAYKSSSDERGLLQKWLSWTSIRAGILGLIEALFTVLVVILSITGLAGGVWLGVRGEWPTILLGAIFMAIGPYLLMVPMWLSMLVLIPLARDATPRSPRAIVCILCNEIYIAAVMCAWFYAVVGVMISNLKHHSLVPAFIWSQAVAVAPWAFMASKEPDNEYTQLTLLAYSIATAIVLVRLAVLGSFDIWSLAIYAAIMLGVGIFESVIALRGTTGT